MKLIDILVKELPGLGGWPEGAEVCAQDNDGEVTFFAGTNIHRRANNLVWAIPEGSYTAVVKRQIYVEKAEDMQSKIVHRGQYQVALSAVNTAWDGKGKPPVGSVCHVLFDSDDDVWVKGKILGHDDVNIIGRWLEGPKIGELFDYTLHGSFRRILTEPEVSRELAATAMASAPKPCGHAIYPICLQIYDAIAAGKIPGVQLVEKE